MLRMFDLDVLHAEESTLVAIDPVGVITWVNPTWHQFAARNGAPDLARRFGPGAS